MHCIEFVMLFLAITMCHARMWNAKLFWNNPFASFNRAIALLILHTNSGKLCPFPWNGSCICNNSTMRRSYVCPVNPMLVWARHLFTLQLWWSEGSENFNKFTTFNGIINISRALCSIQSMTLLLNAQTISVGRMSRKSISYVSNVILAPKWACLNIHLLCPRKAIKHHQHGFVVIAWNQITFVHVE